MKKYGSYTDSGIEWIGKIPSHWELKPLKYLVFCNQSSLAENTNPDIEINYIEIGDVNPIDGIKETCLYRFNEAPSRARRIVKEGDVIISTVRTYLKAIASISSMYNGYIASTGFAVLTPKSIHSGFLGKIVLNEGFIGEIISLSKGVSYPSVTAQDLMNISIPLPEIKEQTTIANFLDHKTAQIDDLIAKKERLIQLLDEECTAIINQAVTKGLNPNVPMKDSGIEWLGEIPEHWEVIHVKHVANIQGRVGYKGYTVSDLVSEGEGPYTIGAKHINKENQLDLSNPEFISWEKYYESPEIMVRKGDLLLTQRGTLGKVVYINKEIGEATINPSMVLLNKLKVEAEYLYFFFNSFYFKSWIEFTNTATAVPMISQEQLGNFKLILPPVEERKTLLEVINSKLAGVNKFKETVTKEIELLKEYKIALISEVVTGKVDVSAWLDTSVRNEKLN
jgi:type I restriction enzyme S subunit